MKVILLEEVAGKGHEGDIVDVARGFAVNYLFPRRIAVQATSGNIKQLEARRANIEKREASRRADAESLAAMIEGKSVVIEAKAGEEGRLFGSVTSTMIQDAIMGQLSAQVDRRRMDVGAHIKDVGDHEVSVRISHDVSATVMVRVIPEGGQLEDRVSFMDDAERAAEQLLASEDDFSDDGEDDIVPPEESAMHEETEEEAEALLEDAPDGIELETDEE